MKKFLKIQPDFKLTLVQRCCNGNGNNCKCGNSIIFKFLMLIFLIAIVTSSEAQIYVNSFTGTGICPTQGNTPVVAANATGAVMSRNTTTCTTALNVFNSTTLNATASISNTSYIEFSATANPGFQLDVTSLSFFRQGSASAPNQLEVRYSTDNFVNSTSWGAAPLTPATGTVITWDFADFSTPAAGTVKFRFYPFGTQRVDLTLPAASSAGTFRVDEVTLNGTVSASVSASLAVGPLVPGATFSTFQGTPSAAQTFALTGANLTASLDVLAVTGYEYSDDGFATAGQSSLTYITANVSKTISVRLTGASVGTFNGSIAISSTGASGSPASVTVTGTVLSASPAISVGALTPAGSFSTTFPTPSGAKTFTLNGTNLTASLDVAAVAGYEYSDDGFATAGQSSLTYVTATVSKTISVRLTGASAGTFNGSIGVSSTGATGSPASIALTGTVILGPVISEVLLPQYMQGVNGTNSNRLPYSCLLTLNTLTPNAIYNYFTAVVIASDLSNSSGAGNCIFPAPGGFTRTASSSLSSAGNFGTFTADGSGSYTGWFIVEPTGNARFTPGTNVFIRIMLNDGAGGTAVAARPTTTNSITVLNLVGAAGITNGTGLRGTSLATDKNFVVLYDNVNGTGRPVSASFVESDGSPNTVANSYANFYATNVETVSGSYGLVIPNTNGNGIRRIEQRTLSNGNLIGCAATDVDGVWPSGVNTINPAGGTTALVIAASDAPLAGNFNVLSSAGSGGTIFPSGISSVVCGNGKSYTITPNPCFVISNVTVDGVSQGPLTSFTFTNVQAVHIISAAFVSAPPALAAITNNSGTTVLTCAVANISLTATGNGAFLWDDGSTSASRNVTSPSTYIVTVTTPQGCTASSSVSVTQALPLVVSVSSTLVSCVGGTNGTATALPSGGLPLYSYVWSNSQTGQIATGLSAGVFTVVVTDGGSCTATATVSVNEPAAPLVSGSPGITNVLCNGGSNGQVDFSTSISGGTVPYSYLWSAGQTTALLTGLATGTYSVTITDFGGCTISASANVGEPAILVINTAGSTAGCNGNSGTVATTVGGGISPYGYIWSNGSTFSAINGLTQGTYTVTVMDANGCTISAQGVVTAPLSISGITSNIVCRGAATGTITSNVVGGTSPYTYLWNGGNTNSGRTGLGAGSYTVTVSDASGCTKTKAFTISQPVSFLLTNSTQTNIRCAGLASGKITISPFGGVSPYTYSWNTIPVNTTASVSGLIAGVYICTYTDAIGCAKQILITITQPTALSGFQSQTNVTAPAGNDGTATVVASGGVPGYTYSWNTIPVKTTASITGLTSGTYKLTLTDSKSCALKLTYVITEPTSKFTGSTYPNEKEWDLLSFPNPSSGTINLYFYSVETKLLTINLFDLTGRNVYEKNTHSAIGENQISFDLKNVTKGLYMLKITSGNKKKFVKLVLH